MMLQLDSKEYQLIAQEWSIIGTAKGHELIIIKIVVGLIVWLISSSQWIIVIGI